MKGGVRFLIIRQNRSSITPPPSEPFVSGFLFYEIVSLSLLVIFYIHLVTKIVIEKKNNWISIPILAIITGVSFLIGILTSLVFYQFYRRKSKSQNGTQVAKNKDSA